MHELAILAVVVAAAMAATTIAAGLIGRLLKQVELALMMVAAAIAFFVMLFVSAEVLMRYLLDAPIAGHLELSELLMPIIVFLGLSYTQATHGHVGMDLVLDSLPPRPARVATMATLFVSICVCSIFAWFSTKGAYQLWQFDDVTMSPPYFKTWPAGAAIALGYTLISLRLYVQLLHLYDPQRFPANEPEAAGLHAVE